MMKRIVLFILMIQLVALIISGNNSSSESESELIASVKETTTRGADDVNTLSTIVYSAIKYNDFAMLTSYIPNDSEIGYLKKTSSEKERYIFEALTHQKLSANTRLNFEYLINEGVTQGINWSEVEIQESQIKMCKAGDERRCEALMTLADQKGNSMKISFDMIKVKERWFLFQGIRVDADKNEKTSAG